jgi:hypothetical protein
MYWKLNTTISHKEYIIYLDEMEETEGQAIVQGKLDYFLTNQTIQVPSSIDKKAKAKCQLHCHRESVVINEKLALSYLFFFKNKSPIILMYGLFPSRVICMYRKLVHMYGLQKIPKAISFPTGEPRLHHHGIKSKHAL